MATKPIFKQKTLDKLSRVNQRIAKGESVADACRLEGMSSSQMHALRKAGLASGSKTVHSKKKPKKHKHEFIDLVNPHTGSNVSSINSVAIVVCAVDQIKSVIAGLI